MCLTPMLMIRTDNRIMIGLMATAHARVLGADRRQFTSFAAQMVAQITRYSHIFMFCCAVIGHIFVPGTCAVVVIEMNLKAFTA